MSLPEFVNESVAYLETRGIPKNLEAAVILGSGLGSYGKQIENPTAISYEQIPNFPTTSVKGHDGKLIFGHAADKQILAFSGRFHHYEGYTFEQAALPVYIAQALKARKLIISNAAGAINTNFSVGDLMVIDAVLRQNMSISPKGHPKHRYNHYPAAETARELAAELELSVQRGNYLYAKGPNYETKAEIRAFRTMGADAVGMSTAPELFEAARLGLKAVAVSLISNMAAGVSGQKLNHEEVKEAAESRKEDFAMLVSKLIAEL